MVAISHKSKQFFLVTVKILIVSGAIYYIYKRFNDDKQIDFNQIKSYLSIKTVVILTAFSCLNWVFESCKWKHLVSSFTEISFFEAMNQSLGSLTASIFTPNRIGEYVAKALYFPKENTKQILLLNFIGNSSQMLVTTVFGVIGFYLLRFNLFQFVSISIILGIPIFVIILIYIFRNIEIYGFSIKKLIQKISTFSFQFHLDTLRYSILRYFTFSVQFLFLLFIFEIELDFKIAYGTILTLYLLTSIIPTIHFMDVAIKGSVALFLFEKLGIENWKIATIISIMWFFNLVIPLLVGSVFVLKFKTTKT